ncbi:MAG: TolC family protein [Odoribacter sp.]|nr:TolC family protein [Odoribacter sp.]
MNLKRLLSAAMATAVSVPLALASESFTLEECLAIALSDNPTVKIADMEVVKADYSRRETLGQLLPSVSFDGSYQRTLKKQVAYMNMDAFGSFGDSTQGDDTSQDDAATSIPSGDTGIKMGLDNMYSLGFQASVPIVAPQLWASLKLSDVQIERAVEQARSSRLDLVNQVKNAYYALQLALDSRRVVQESYDMAELTYKTYSRRFEVGDASEYEVLRTSVALKNIEPEIIQCDIEIRRARLQLAILMGIDVNTPFEIEGSLAEYESTMYDDVMNLSSDLSSNTSLIMNSIETRTLERTLSVQKASWYPTVALTGNYNWMSSSNGSPFKNFRWTPYSIVGLSVSIPLYQGGQRYNRIKQARIQLDEMAYVRENLTNTLNSQVAIAIDNIRLNVKQIASSNESVGEASRAHDIQVRSFDIGATTYLDLRDSELSLTRARLAYYQAIYNYLVAGSDLELLLGNAPIESYTSVTDNN